MAQTASKRRRKAADNTPTRNIAAMAEKLDQAERRDSTPPPRPVASAGPSPAVVVSVPSSRCLVCDKAVYLVEQVEVDGIKFHKG